MSMHAMFETVDLPHECTVLRVTFIDIIIDLYTHRSRTIHVSRNVTVLLKISVWNEFS